MDLKMANPENTPSSEKQSSDYTKSTKKLVSNESKSPDFVNYASFLWHENREKWVGEQSQRTTRTEKDQIISWSTSYEDLLSSNDPFSEPIPLPEMVDFLVDIWHDEGLYDSL